MDGSKIGLEKVIMKHGKFIGYFIQDQHSGFYSGPDFQRVLKFVQSQPKVIKLKEKQTRYGLRLLLIIESVTSVPKPCAIYMAYENPHISHVLWLTLATLFISTSGPLGKFIAITPVTLVWWRSVLSLCILTTVLPV